MSPTIIGGYSHNLCVRCYTGPSNEFYQDIDNWSISVIDCATTSTLQAAAATDKSYAYDASSSGQLAYPSSAYTTWDSFFQNTHPTACPIGECVVGDAGDCGNAGSFTGLTIDTANPWKITMDTTVEDGYSHNLCVRCYTGPSNEHY